MSMAAQRGSVTLAAMLALLLLGLLALVGWQRRLDRSLDLMRDETAYLAAFHQAESALAWGAQQRWRGEDEECQHPPGDPFRACLQAGASVERWILRGESGLAAGLPGRLCLYRLVAADASGARAGGADATAPPRPAGDRGRYKLVLLPHGWLDYPPG